MLRLARSQRPFTGLVARLSLAAITVLGASDTIVARAATTLDAPVRYSEDRTGFAVEAPAGWRRVPHYEVALPSIAKAGFLGPESGVFVYVVVEFIPGGLISRNDAALSTYLASHMMTTDNATVRTKPVPTVLAGRRALRGSMSISTGRGTLVKTLTAAREGYCYFVIVSIAEASAVDRQSSIHREFESRTTIAKTSDEIVDTVARRLGGYAPYFTAEDLRFVTCAILDRATALDGIDAATLGLAFMAAGRDRLPTSDFERLDALQKKASSSLPPEQVDFVLRLRRDKASGLDLSREDEERHIQIVRQAYASLTPAELAIVRRIAFESIRLGLEAFDSGLTGALRARMADPDLTPGGVPGGIPDGIPRGDRDQFPANIPLEYLDRARLTPARPPVDPRIQRVSGGVLAGKAIQKPQPPYPQMARAADIEGAVVVEVTVSEAGVVQSARAVSGHPLLREAAVLAARKWTFRPTTLQGQPIKVVGTITFTFRKPPPPDDTP